MADFPGGPVVKNLPCSAGDAGLILGWGTKIPQTFRAPKPMHHSEEFTGCNKHPAQPEINRWEQVHFCLSVEAGMGPIGPLFSVHS